MSASPVSTSPVRGTGSISQTTTGKDESTVRTIKTPSYQIEIRKGEVIITNPSTGASVRAWGDPHLHTSDGDLMKFHTDNLTIDLPDGTKVTIVPTPVNEHGVAYIDSVVVMNGDKAVQVKGLDPRRAGVVPVETTFDSHHAVRNLDRQIADGTVVRPGSDVDDLRCTTGKDRMLGRLACGSEEGLDGLGGLSNNMYRGYEVDDSNMSASLDRLQSSQDRYQRELEEESGKEEPSAARIAFLQRKLATIARSMDTLLGVQQAEIEAQNRRLQAFLESLRSIS